MPRIAVVLLTGSGWLLLGLVMAAACVGIARLAATTDHRLDVVRA